MGENLTTKGHEEFFADGTILYLDHAGGYVTIYVCRNLHNCTLKWKDFNVTKLYLKQNPSQLPYIRKIEVPQLEEI